MGIHIIHEDNSSGVLGNIPKAALVEIILKNTCEDDKQALKYVILSKVSNMQS